MQRLSDAHWERIREHFPEESYPTDRPGRKPVPAREVLNAVLWILNTGAQWHMLPQCFPNYKTVHRRFQQWCRQEVLRDVLTRLANELAPWIGVCPTGHVAYRHRRVTRPTSCAKCAPRFDERYVFSWSRREITPATRLAAMTPR